MRGFTEFAGHLTRLVYCKERGAFVAEAAPHPFEAGGVLPKPSLRGGPADKALRPHAVTCPSKEKQNDR